MSRHLRLIKGGSSRSQPDQSGNGMSLYRAYSYSNLTRGELVYYDVRFNWYCVGRQRPIADYAQLIAEYDALDEKQRKVSERDVDRYFTKDEAEGLRDYLQQRFGMELTFLTSKAPIKQRSYFFEEGASVIYDFLELSEQPGYWLPFKVWGYYTLSQCLDSSALRNGVAFLKKSFELLGIAMKFDPDSLERTIRTIYQQNKLSVMSDKDEPGFKDES